MFLSKCIYKLFLLTPEITRNFTILTTTSIYIYIYNTNIYTCIYVMLDSILYLVFFVCPLDSISDSEDLKCIPFHMVGRWKRHQAFDRYNGTALPYQITPAHALMSKMMNERPWWRHISWTLRSSCKTEPHINQSESAPPSGRIKSFLAAGYRFKADL